MAPAPLAARGGRRGVELGRTATDPVDEAADVRMGPQPLEVRKGAREFALAEQTVELAMTDPVHAHRDTAALALGEEMVTFRPALS